VSAPTISDTKFGTATVYLGLAAVATVLAGPLVMNEILAYGLAVALGAGALGSTILESIAAPTPGKLLFLVGFGLLVGPVFVDAIPFKLFWGAFPALVLARYYRMQEVRP